MKLGENLSNVSASTGYSVWEPGEYTVTVFDTSVTNSKAGNRMVKVEFVNQSNQHIWDYFVLNSDVGKSRFKGLLIACGHPNPDFINDTEEIHGLEVTIAVGVVTDAYGEKNKITKYIAPERPAAKPQPAPKTQPTAPKRKPWELGDATDAF